MEPPYSLDSPVTWQLDAWGPLLANGVLRYSKLAHCNVIHIILIGRCTKLWHWRSTMATRERQHKELTRRFHEEVWGTRNLAAVDEQVAADFVGHDPALPEPVRGPGGVRETAETFQSAFPDATVDIEQLVAEGDRLAVHRTLTGTHEGSFMGIEPTGTSVEIPGIAIYRIEDGLIAEEWQVIDMFGLLVQLGAVDPPTG